MRRVRAAALLLVGSLSLAACRGSGATTPEPVVPTSTSTSTGAPTVPEGPVPSADDPVPGGSLRYALAADPSSLDPAYADDEEAQLVVDALFDSLTTLDAQLRPVPGAAQSWTVSDDQQTWTFRIDPRQQFHDGTPVTAEDFARAFRRLADGTLQPRPFLAYQLTDVDGFEAAQSTGEPLSGVGVDDEGQLVIRLQRPNADFASVVSHPTLGPVPQAALDNAFSFGQQPIGNGPFRMAEAWAHDQFIRITRADDDVLLDEVLFRIYSDDPGQAQVWADFTAGQLHVARVPAGQRRDALASYGQAGDGTDGPGVLNGPWATSYHYGFNTTRAPFDNPIVRQAVSLLVDRESLAADVLLSTRTPATSLLPVGMNSIAEDSCPWCQHDPEAAIALLEDAEIVLDPAEIGPLELLHLRGQTDAAIAGRIADAITEHLGLEVTVRELGLTAYATAIREGEGHLHRAGWTADHAMPGAFLVPLFHSREVGDDNHSAFVDPEVDLLLDQAASTADLRQRLDLYAQASSRIGEQAPIIPMFDYGLGRIVSDDVGGFRMDALTRVNLADVWLRP